MVATRTEQSVLNRPRTEHERDGFVEAVDGTRIYYRQIGTGPAVVLCDGILCDGFVWKYLRPHLARSYTVVHWNYRGHGRSGPPRDPTRVSIPDLANDLWQMLDALDIERAVLIGHSMGTQVCLEGYRAAPDRVAGLVLVCGSYGKITRTFHGTDALARALPTLLDLRARHPRLFRSLFAYTPARLALKVARLAREIDPLRARAEDMLPYFQHLSTMDPEVYLRMLQAAGEHSAEDFLHRVHTPTLVIAAECDTFTPPRLAEQMATQIEGAEFVLVPEGSHSVPIEQPEVVNAHIERFLSERAYP